jgi:hypothetical protein
MKRTLIILVVAMMFAPLAVASDSSSATRFLRAYVDMLCAEKAGNHEKAVEAITPFVTIDGPDMTSSAKDALRGQYADSAVSATWSLVTNSRWGELRSMRFAVSWRDRREAIAALREAFGRSITNGPMEGQPQLRKAAATLAWFLTQDLDGVAQPRDFYPRRGR